jgi:hypothetical protein
MLAVTRQRHQVTFGETRESELNLVNQLRAEYR